MLAALLLGRFHLGRVRSPVGPTPSSSTSAINGMEEVTARSSRSRHFEELSNGEVAEGARPLEGRGEQSLRSGHGSPSKDS